MTEKNNQIPAHGSNVCRADIPTACKWHVQDIYADESAWKKACAEFKELLPKLKAMQGTLTTGPAIYAALRLQDAMAQLIDNPSASPERACRCWSVLSASCCRRA